MKFSKAEIEAVLAASPRITVPYNKLLLSQDYQVRPSGSTSNWPRRPLMTIRFCSTPLALIEAASSAMLIFDVLPLGRTW